MASGFWRIARRPQWVAALLLCLGIAAGFAALGQWQLSRSIETAPADAPDTEIAVPLDSIAEPQTEVTQPQLGRRVTVTGELVPGDLIVLTGRDNGDAVGAWLVGHLVTDDRASLAVALGWAPDAAAASAAEDGVVQAVAGDLTGRYLPSESPPQSDFEEGERSAIAVAELINIWPEVGPVYGGYLVLDDPAPGLAPILSPAPTREVEFNLLNLFYAVEWAIFAGFAVYLWYRLVRDVVEREAESAPGSATVE